MDTALATLTEYMVQVHPGDAAQFNMAAVLEDNVAKGRRIEDLEAAAIVERERSAAVHNEVKGALAKTSTELEGTKQRLVEALRYLSLPHMTASLSHKPSSSSHFFSDVVWHVRDAPPQPCTDKYRSLHMLLVFWWETLFR
jgi:hypothetical protein